jgi:hypothetical protein
MYGKWKKHTVKKYDVSKLVIEDLLAIVKSRNGANVHQYVDSWINSGVPLQ